MTWKVRKNNRSQKGGWIIDIRVALPDRTVKREQYRAKASTKVGAETEAKDREAHLIKYGPSKPIEESESVLFKDFWIRFHEGRKQDDLKPSTLYWERCAYGARLKGFFDDMVLDDISTDVIANFRRKLRNPTDEGVAVYGKKACNNIFGLLGKMFKTAVAQGVMKEVPKIPYFDKLKKEKIKVDGVECYSDVHLEPLLAEAKKISEDLYLMTLLGADAGLRFGEILGVMPMVDCNFQKKVLTVNRSLWWNNKKLHVGLPKSGITRAVPMSDRLVAALALHAQKQGYALLDAKGLPYTPKAARNLMKAAQGAAGLKVTGRLHVLRHTFGSRLAARNIAPKTIQSLMGHSNITTTEIYLHSDDQLEQKAINALNPVPPVTSVADVATVLQPKLALVSVG